METWKCNFCNKEIELKKPSSRSIHLRYCKSYIEVKENIWTKDFLYNEYIEKGKSAKEIADDFGLSSAISIIKKLKEYGINTRSISKSKLQSRCKEKTKNTNLERYGIEHNLQTDSPFRTQMEMNILKKYGVTNVFQTEEVKDKIKKTNLERYGVEHIMQNDDIKEKVWESTFKNNGVKYGIINAHHIKKSNPQMIIEGILRDEKVEFIDEYKIFPYYVDMFCVKEKKVIEVYGDFWHANPLKYKKDDILNFPKGEKVLVEDKWNKDIERINHIKLQGYDVLVVWEHDINSDIENVKEKIWNFLKSKI